MHKFKKTYHYINVLLKSFRTQRADTLRPFSIFPSLRLVIIIALIIGVTVGAPAQNISALTKTQDLNTTDMAKSFAAYRWLRSCLDRGNFSKFDKSGVIAQDQVNNYKWFGGALWGIDANISTSGVINEPNDGDTSCTQDEGPALIGSSLKLWGYSSGAEFLCDIGFTRDVGAECTNISSSGTNDFISPDGTSKIDAWWTGKMGNSGTDVSSIKIGGEYALYLQSFLAKCGAPSPNGEYSIQTFAPGSDKPTNVKYTAVNRDYTRTSGDVRIYQDRSMKCGELADQINDPSDSAVLNYIKYLSAHNNTDTGNPLAPQCPEGSTNPECNKVETGSSCVVDGIGWIVCPVMNFLAGIVDAAYGFVAALLAVQPLVTTGENAGVYNAWLVMRNIANIAFIIAFLLIIFSQISSVGISNYGVKKMLPRLVIAAILVNLSFLVCAIAVDISNILGTSIKGIFESVGASIKQVELSDPVWSTGNGWEGITAVVLAGGAGVALYVGLSALVPAILAAFVAIVTVFIVLALRQALIILLIVVAPLAFVAYLLPNTEDWFTKWRKLFMTLLLMFPIIAGMFGASALASKIVMNSAHETAFAIPIQIMGALIAILPLAVTPLVMRAAGGVLNRFAGIVNNAEKGPIDRVRRGAEGYRKNRQEYRKLKSLNGGRSLPGFGAATRGGVRRQAILNNRQAELKRSTAEYISDKAENVERFRNQLAQGGGAGSNQRALDQALNIKASIEAEEVKAATNRIERVVLNEQELRDVASGQTRKGINGADLATRRAAYQQLGARGDFQGMNDAWDDVRTSDNQELRRAFADSMASSSNKPGWMGHGALQSLRETDSATGLSKAHSTTSRELVEGAIKNNVYSADKQVSTDKEELRIVAEVNHTSTVLTVPEKQALINNAALAQTDPKLKTQIGKNADAIDHIRTNTLYP